MIYSRALRWDWCWGTCYAILLSWICSSWIAGTTSLRLHSVSYNSNRDFAITSTPWRRKIVCLFMSLPQGWLKKSFIQTSILNTASASRFIMTFTRLPTTGIGKTFLWVFTKSLTRIRFPKRQITALGRLENGTLWHASKTKEYSWLVVNKAALTPYITSRRL